MPKTTPPSPRPFIFLNVATTVDGKIAPANRHFVPFSSRRDQELLFELRTTADAVMAGARTVDSGKVDLGPGPARFRKMRLQNGLAEHNLRVIVTGSGKIDPQAHIFSTRFSPIIILTTERARPYLERLRGVAEIGIFGREKINLPAALVWLRKEWKVKRLLCEGGGELNGALFRLGLVDEIYHTLSPVIFGGRDAPTMADETGISKNDQATRLKLKSLQRHGDELFLVYKVIRQSSR